MAVIVSCQSITKAFGARPLFQDISLGVGDEERMGMIGPNGAGKSTLLKIFAGRETPDSGTVSTRKNARVGYVPQDEEFPPGATVESILVGDLAREPLDEIERDVRIDVLLARVGFEGKDQEAQSLSGGWRKRLSLARTLVQEPDLLLLDEPTNHLDLEGVMWLESFLKAANFAYVVVSHDRVFLESISRRVLELDPTYAEGYLSVEGPYSAFLERREEYVAAQAHREQALAGQVKREIEWLRRGPQARTTKAQARIDSAGRMIEDLAGLKARNRSDVAAIDFDASGRKTKDLLVAKELAKTLGDRLLFKDLSFILSPGSKLGLIGPNGSGKTTLLRLLTGALEPDHGSIKWADGLRTVLFDQAREQLETNVSLRDALCPNGETVVYQGNSIHVSSWAKRFLFRAEQLPVAVSRLSGGEQARVLIARLMLQPADLLILDEPTNDLDIPTLEILEESLASFSGALLLVTHDRYLLDRVSTEVLALDGRGGARFFADLAQWERHQSPIEPPKPSAPAKPMKAAPTPVAAPAAPAGRLSTAERRELKQMEEKIEEAENAVKAIQDQMASPAVASNPVTLQEFWSALPRAEAEVSRLYARWEELEAKQG